MIRIMSKETLDVLPKYLIFIIIVSLIFVGYLLIPRKSSLASLRCKDSTACSELISLNGSQIQNNVTSSRTLVIYVYGKTHASAEQNLAFFIRTAVRPSQNADYYFILQRIDNKVIDETKLPILPSNAHYIQHENKCFDIGTIGWFLSSGMIDKTKYKYFIFLNSSVRGPFIVSYFDRAIWYTIFTQCLNDQIKLVGCTINCENAPHVQSYLWTMDLETLDLLLKNSTVFACHGTKTDTINNAEVHASQILLHSGFGIGCLMTKYRDVDFRLNVTQKCPNKLNPVYDKGGGEITLDPYEVVFVKIKDGKSPYHDNFERVRVYENWIQ